MEAIYSSLFERNFEPAFSIDEINRSLVCKRVTDGVC